MESILGGSDYHQEDLVHVLKTVQAHEKQKLHMVVTIQVSKKAGRPSERHVQLKNMLVEHRCVHVTDITEVTGLEDAKRRRGRGKSRNGSSGSSLKNEVGIEHPGSSLPIKLPYQTVVSLDQQKKRLQRNSARNTSVHIISQESDSDIEKDNACSEESFHVSNEDAYSSSDAYDTEDSGQILLLSKSNDFPLPSMKPLHQSLGDRSGNGLPEIRCQFLVV